MDDLRQATEEAIQEVRYVAKYEYHFQSFFRGIQALSIIFLGTLVIVMIIQIVLPTSYARPLMKVNGVAVGLEQADQINIKLQKLDQKKITFKMEDGKELKYTLANMGVAVDPNVAQNVTSYSISERLKPFSLFSTNFKGQVKLNIADQRIEAFTKQFAIENSSLPKSAKILTDTSGYRLQEHKLGVVYESKTIERSIKSAALLNEPTVILPSKLVEPSVTNEEVSDALAIAKSASAKDFSLTIEGKAYTIPASTVKSWITISENQELGVIDVHYDSTAIKAWLNNIASNYYVAARASTSTLLDGVLVSSYAGNNGKKLNTEALTSSIIGALSRQESTVTAVTDQIVAEKKAVRTYSQENSGLNQLIIDWVKAHPNGQFGIAVRELSGKGRSANYNSDQLFFAASLYKLYVVNYLFHRIEDGSLSSSATLGSNRSINDCINVAILVSDNACPEGVVNAVGWGTVDSFAKSVTGGVSLKNGNIQVSASGTADFMVKLYGGNLMSADNTSRLIELMKQQKFRTAIPAGSYGVAVADKVGFYNGSWHDVGIVYGEKSTYVLSVLSKASGAAQIADLAQQIYNNMN